jgi:HAD superfamily hydrolase (TIGR01484 family)
MRYHALACDYDGTLARHGRVDEATIAALTRAQASGRRLLLVTGRLLPELLEVFPEAARFDHIVAENGALLYHPQTGETKDLGPPFDRKFVAELERRGVSRIATGRVIVATWRPFEKAVLETIRELGLELQVIFNKGAVMVLPSGINKATGLMAALSELGLSARNVVGVGDAENDHAFLSSCECGVAVANALPTLKERADVVTTRDHGEGVQEIIEQLLANDLAVYESRLVRHRVELGTTAEGEEIALPGYGSSLLVAGTSGAGKSTFATGVMERMLEKKAQIVVIDPEGDYSQVEGLAALGNAQSPLALDEAMEILRRPDQSLSLNLLGIGLASRPEFFGKLWLRLNELRAAVGRPHWIIVDEAHHVLPQVRRPEPEVLPSSLSGVVWITVHPESLSRAVLSRVDRAVAIGNQPARTLVCIAEAHGLPPPLESAEDLPPGEAIFWQLEEQRPRRFRTVKPRSERRRHVRKYAAGELPQDRSFYFRGPAAKLNLRAANLMTFLELADGVDDETWLFHLRRGEYSKWFQSNIKDDELAEEAARIEAESDDPTESRARFREIVTRRYTLPP